MRRRVIVFGVGYGMLLLSGIKMVNVIWLFLISLGIGFSLVTGKMDIINAEVISSANNGIEMVFRMMPLLILWMGIMQIALKSGLLDLFAKVISPFLGKIFPSLESNDPALGYIASNIAANMIGLGSAATPFGLKAMAEMQKKNIKKDEATEAMITFLVLNTSGVTIIPTTVIALRMAHNSANPSEIIITSLLATIMSSTAGLLMDYGIRKRKK